MKFVCALYFNAFVIYNSCNYTKTAGKPSLCTLVNKKKQINMSTEMRRIQHSFILHFLFVCCLWSSLKHHKQVKQANFSSSPRPKMKLELVDKCYPPLSLRPGREEMKTLQKERNPNFQTDGSLTVRRRAGV